MKPPRRFSRPRFTLAALLVLITLIAFPLAYIAQRRAWNLQRKAAYEALELKGVTLNNIGLNEPPNAKGIELWIRQWLLEDITPQVCDIYYEFPNLIQNASGDYEFGTTTPLTDRDLQSLALFPELQQIDLNGAEECTDNGLQVICRLPRLEAIELIALPKVTGGFFKHYSNTRRLSHLFFVDLPRLSGEELSIIGKCGALNSLTLDRCPLLTDEALKNVDIHSKLEYLTIENCPVGDETIERWLRPSQLLELTLTSSTITRQSAAAIGRQQKLEHLHIAGAPLLDEDFQFLAHCGQLETLKLEAMPIRGELLRSISTSAKNLSECSFRATLFDDARLPLLEPFSRLQRLRLSWTPLTGEGLPSISGLKSLTMLDLHGTQLSDRGKAVLAAMKGRKADPSCVFAPNIHDRIPLIWMPDNWTLADLDRFPNRTPPWPLALDPAAAEEAIAAIGDDMVFNSNRIVTDYAPSLANAPADLLAPVFRLYELAKIDPQQGAEEPPKE